MRLIAAVVILATVPAASVLPALRASRRESIFAKREECP